MTQSTSLSFSAAMQQISPQKDAPYSPALTLSPASDSRPSASVSNPLSTVTALVIDTTQQPVVEDALRARAEQAESAAERLLELVEPEDDLANHPTLPPSLLKTT
jgi:CLIP-associating protein 1/2